MVKRRTRRKSRTMRRSRSARRSARRSRSMRGGRITGDSSYSTYLNSDNTSDISGSSGAALQNTDRNNSSISGEGANVNMSDPAFQGLIPPSAYYGGRRRRGRKSHRRSRKMRGGDDSEASIADEAVNEDEILTGDDLAQEGGRRRRRRRRSMRGGEAGPMPTEPVDPDMAPILNGGSFDPPADRPAEPGDSAKMSTGGRRRRRGGGIIATAALPFGLFGLQRLFQGRNKGKTHRRR